MASIIDALRNISEDTLWFPKVAIISSIACHLCYLYLSESISAKDFVGLAIIFTCFLFGVCSFHINSVINNSSPALPGVFNAFNVARNSLIAPLLFLPGAIAGYAVYGIIQNSFQEQEPSFYYIAMGVTILLFIPFSVIPVVLYSIKNELADALNMNIIIKSAGNFIVETLSFSIQYALTVLLFWILIYYLIDNMFGFNTVTTSIFYPIAFTTTVLIFFSYSGNTYGSCILEIEALESTGRRKYHITEEKANEEAKKEKEKRNNHSSRRKTS